ncbi:hypothetical protein ACFW04_014100 [Cataglyphis niger]
MQSMIVMPDNHEYEDISAVFQRKTNIPQLISAIDGTHIPILLPTDGYRDFINLPGASNDAAVLKNSNLYKNCNLLIPPIACCILHNIVETHKEKFLQAWEYINESNVNQQPESLRTQDLDNFNA